MVDMEPMPSAPPNVSRGPLAIPADRRLDGPVLDHARKDFATLRQDLTVEEALQSIRRAGAGEKIIYFYVVDEDDRLTGVLPTRRLLMTDPGRRLREIMIGPVIAIPQEATLGDACEYFTRHKLLAFPVVDGQRRMQGIVDIGLFAEEVSDLAEREKMDMAFESIGFRLSQVRDASPFRAFRFRFPWLLATIASGMTCAFLASAFELTLARSIVLAFFITLVLGLGESVSIQSMTVTIQMLRASRPTLRWYLRSLGRELGTAFLLGSGCAAVVGVTVWLWRGAATAALSIGGSILLAMVAACFFGLSIPALLHALRLDPKVAAGPVTLALADIFTLLFFFGLAALVL